MSTDHVVFKETKKLEPLEELAQLPSLRPKTFSEYPGQNRICENLKIWTIAAKKRKKMLDHCLFHGPPGLGKTTLAGIVASEMQCQLKITSGPVLERPGDLMGILASLEANTVLFVDEIHRIPSHVEEVLYSALEDGRVDIMVGDGPNARSLSLDLKPFTLIGATTRAGALSAPLRDRFGIVEHLEFYAAEDLSKIISRSAKILGFEINSEASLVLAKRSRGTPRIANKLLARSIDFAVYSSQTSVLEETVQDTLLRLNIDEEGLTEMDRKFLQILISRYEGGPAGLEAVAAALGEEKETLEDVYEPYLVYRGFLLRTQRGRVVSDTGRKHLKSTAFSTTINGSVT
jgi:holliday junction DNA helicase RuvB